MLEIVDDTSKLHQLGKFGFLQADMPPTPTNQLCQEYQICTGGVDFALAFRRHATAKANRDSNGAEEQVSLSHFKKRPNEMRTVAGSFGLCHICKCTATEMGKELTED